MNDRNKDLFFENEEGEITTMILTDDDGNTVEVEIMASMETEGEEKEYIAVLPVEGTEQFPKDRLIILIYSEDEEGNPQYSGINDEEELLEVSKAFMEFFASEE